MVELFAITSCVCAPLSDHALNSQLFLAFVCGEGAESELRDPWITVLAKGPVSRCKAIWLWRRWARRCGRSTSSSRPPRNDFRHLLLRVDPRSDEVAARIPLRTPSGEPFAGLDLAADQDSVWILGTTARWHNDDRIGLMRLDARTGRVTAAFALPGGWGRVGLALRDDGVWAITADHRLLRFDADTGEKLSETRLNLLLGDRDLEPTPGIIHFVGETLVTSTPGGLAGIEPYAARVAWRRHLGQSVHGWTEAEGLIWATVSRQGPDRLVAVYAEDGRVATSVGLGAFGTAGIASLGGELWITTAGGEALVLRR